MIFNIQYTDQYLHNNTGLSIISKLIHSVKPESIFKAHGISTSSRPKDFSDQDIIFSTLALLSLGQPHFESIDLFGSPTNVMFFIFEEKTMECPNCGSHHVKKNGISHTGKQNHYCYDCKRQFLEDGASWFISEEQKELVDKLLLERISLAGIIRVLGVSQSWLYDYIKKLYNSLPDDLNASDSIPDIEK